MADISHISIPSFNIDGDINDTIARTTINNHVADKNNPHNVTKAQIGLGNVDNTSDMDKPISTAVQNALDKKANNTLATESSPGLMSAEDKKAVDREFFKLVPRGATYVPHGADLRDNQYFKVGTYYHDRKPSEKQEERGIIYGMPGAGLHESPLAGEPFTMYVMAPYSDKYDDESTADEMTLERLRIMIVEGSIYTQGAFNRYKVVEPGEGELNEKDWFTDYWTKIADEADINFLKDYIDKHVYSKSNPHGVTKDQVGLGNVDNTADKDKSVNHANSAGYADDAKHAYKAGIAEYAESAGTAHSVAWDNVTGKPSAYPPSSHTHTKDQVGLDNVDNTADKDKSVKYAESAGSANSVAWDNVTGKPSTIDSSVAWDDITDKPSTYPPSSHTHTPDEVGLGNVANLDQSKAIKSITRSGTTFTATALDGTTTTFTQQDADTTSVTWDDITDKPSTYPPSSHTHTPDEVGLGNVDNTADKDKSVKYATTAGTANSITWKNVSDKPSTYPPDAHTHTPSEVGLGNVDNTADLDKPISTAVQKALDGKANTSVATSSTDGLMSKSDKAKLDSIEAGSNVESVNGKTGAVTLNKADIGLGNVDNTVDKDKSVKYAESAGSVDSVAWENVTDKPSAYPPSSHTHIPADIGLGNVDNTADKDKSVKYATTAGTANSVAWDDITNKPSTIASSVAWDDITDKPSTYLPSSHTHTPSEVGLGNVDNTSDVNKPISTAVQNALNNKVTKNNAADTNGLLNSLTTSSDAPKDADYYISQYAGGGTTTTTYHRRPMSALWAFIKSKCDSIYATVSALNAHISNKSNPHGVTKAQVGLGNVDNTADSAKSVKYAASAGSANSVAWDNVSGKPSTYPPAGHSHSYLPLSGGTVTGKLNAAGRLTAPTNGGKWLSGKDVNNAVLGISTQASPPDYRWDPIIAQKDYAGGTWNIGSISNQVGVAGFYKDRTANGKDWYHYIDTTDGTVHFGNQVYANVTGALSGNASTATKATQDSSGQQINSTYIKNLSVSGRTITYTRGDGSTGTVTTQDTNTTYGLASSSSNGLMSAADKSKLDGIGAGSNVKSVNGKTGVVNLSKADVGLGNVDNTADSAKSVKYAESAGSVDSVAWKNVSGKPSTYPPAGHSHSYLPLSGGTVTGKLNAAGRLTAPTNGGFFVSGKDVNNAVLGISTQADSSWHPIIAQMDYAGGTWNIGSIYNQVGIAGFYKDRIDNGYDWYHYIDTINGTVHFNNQVYADVTGSLSGNASSANYANSAGDADTVDGFHEDSFLRYRDYTSTNGAETLWNQIGIRDYDYALPSGLSGVYNYGSVVSLPGRSTRFDLYYSHHSSDGDGLYYRTGWQTDKKGWARLIDSQSIGSQSVKYAESAGHAASADYANSAWATLDSTYPVGSIYMSTNSTSPASLFGGTWLPITNRFLFASGSVYAAGETGGEYNHTLTMDEVIQYGMWISDTADKYNSQIDLNFNAGSQFGIRTYNKSAVAHNNMPPYLVVYMWKRTA